MVQVLQRSLEKGRLGHAYLFTGSDLAALEAAARTLAKTLNCQQPPQVGPAGLPLDCCDTCLSCRKIQGETHADIQWVRPESKLRIISIDQIRDLMQIVHLKPTEAKFKVAVIIAADRLNTAAANAFLKTLEEPPADSILILLSTEPQRLMETILSRCLRLNFGGAHLQLDERRKQWLAEFAALASQENKSLLSRYRLLGALTEHLGLLKEEIGKNLTAESPLEKYEEADPQLVEKWETELAAAIESEYRRQRADLMTTLQYWLRDVWLHTLQADASLLMFPDLAEAAQTVASRVKPEDAVTNLAELDKTLRILHTNVQEALALEVGLLKLKL